MTKGKWELQLKQARELRKQGAAILFQRVVLLNECYESQEFRDWCEQNGTPDLDFLDDELSDTAANFLTLKAVLKEYPDEASWQTHNIRDLIALVIEAERAKREPKDSHKVSWKERALAAERECERLRAENETLKESLGTVASAKCK